MLPPYVTRPHGVRRFVVGVLPPRSGTGAKPPLQSYLPFRINAHAFAFSSFAVMSDTLH
jgi:hypothetical protein